MTPGERLEDSAVLVEDGRIARVGTAAQIAPPREAQVLDAEGLLLAPGLMDLQLNGGFGLDFTAAPVSIWEVAARLPRYGVTSFLPTLVTSPFETMAAAQAVLRSGPPAGFAGAAPLGLHIEGPFLNPQKRGAHNPAYLRLPALDAVASWSPERGVRLVTLAPELPGALELVRALRTRGVVVSAGHSMANYEQAQAGLNAGISYGTHLLNAMPPLEHRAPGLVGALLTDARAVVGIIPDGIHLHPAVVDLVWKSKGAGHVSVVTDAMAALGMAPGRYRLGELEVTVDETRARLEDGRLAGSILSLDQAVRNLVAFCGCSVEDALAAATTVPARLLGLADRGRIAAGCIADLMLYTPDLRVAATIVAGTLVWQA